MNKENKIDYFLWTPHYLDHCLPVWEKLPDHVRGKIIINTQIFDRQDFEEYSQRSNIVWFKNFGRAIEWTNQRESLVGILTVNNPFVSKITRPLFFMDHGLGQFYDVPYNHVPPLPQLVATLGPNQSFKRWSKNQFPDARHEIIGSPLNDQRINRIEEYQPNNAKPVVAVSFHFDRKLCPETRTTFPYFKDAMVPLANHDDFDLVGHAHPRIRERLKPWYEKHGIPFRREFEDVAKQADLYVMDNSSTLFEFAALRKPVVVLNAPFYRREVNHGLRFWEAASVGIQCDGPEDLERSILRALEDPPEQQSKREETLNIVFPYRDGKSHQRAVEQIINLLKNVNLEKNWQPETSDYPGFRSLYKQWEQETSPDTVALLGAGGFARAMLDHSPELRNHCKVIIDPFSEDQSVETIEKIPVKYTKKLVDLEVDYIVLGVTMIDHNLKQILAPVKSKMINFLKEYREYAADILFEIYY